MVKMRFFAAGSTRLWQIEATPDGTVIERSGNLPRSPGRAIQWKSKQHPPAIVGTSADGYIVKLVEAKVREGYEVESNDDSIEQAANQLHLVIRSDAIEHAPVADALVAFGVPAPIAPTPDNRVATCQYGVGGVSVSFERFATGTNVTAVAAINHAKLAALFLCIAKIAGSPCQAADANAVQVNARELVELAIAQNKLDSEIVEFLYETAVLPRPFNVAQLSGTTRTRFAAAM